MFHSKYRQILLIAFLIYPIVGCQSFDSKVAMPWSSDKEEELPKVNKMVAIWTNSVYHQVGAPPTRGFGGRLYFYDETDTPVKVDGDITVYAFNETGKYTPDKQPERKYVLTAEQLARHYSESSIGPSYSMWIPWDLVGGPRKEIQLIPTYKPKLGDVVVGAQTKETLPGISNPAIEQDRNNMLTRFRQTNQGQVRQTGYGYAEENQRTTDLADLRKKTVTIKAPPSLKKRWQQSAYLRDRSTPQQTTITSQSLDQPAANRPVVNTYQPRIYETQSRVSTFQTAAEFFSRSRNSGTPAATTEQSRDSRWMNSGQRIRSTGYQRPQPPAPTSPAFQPMYDDEPN